MFSVRCETKLCWKMISPDLDKEWNENEYCEYIDVLCHNCGAHYWMVKRCDILGDSLSIQLKTSERFDNRSSLKKDLR